MRILLSILLLTFAVLPAAAQITNRDLPNLFTNQSVIPHGCLTIVPSVLNQPPASVDYDETITVIDDTNSAVVRVRAWRIGCHEPARSAIAVNFAVVEGSSSVRYPRVELVPRDALIRPAGLFHFGHVSYYDNQGAASQPMTDQLNPNFVEGVSLIVDAHAEVITAQKYNAEIVLRLIWPSAQVLTINIPDHVELTDLAQFERPALHGRYTGNWVVEGLPRQGLMLQIGELPPYRNYIFLAMMTYMNGQPTWLIGNTDFPAGTSEVAVGMWLVEGGEFLTEPLNSYQSDNVSQNLVGTMTIRPRHCNVLDVDIDFSTTGHGQVSRRFERMLRVAGYDCDQTN